MENDQTYDPAGTFMGKLAIFTLALAILSFVSPQVGQLGRGMRTALPALVISFCAISMISPSAFFRSISRYKLVLLFGFLFLLQGAYRFASESYKPEMSWHTFFKGPALALMFLIWVGALSELGERTVRRFRTWFLFCWCISLALGVPVLLTHLGVARLTMGNVHEAQNAAKWAPYGVGEYAVYNSMAICLAPLYILATRQMKGILRPIAMILVCLGGIAVYSATFAMASILATLSITALLLVGIINAKGFGRMVRISAVGILIFMAPLLYIQARQLPQTEFLIEKLERISKGVEKKGLEKGDVTARGGLFMADIRGFMESPIIGYIPGVIGYRDHGHSSLGNSLTHFGLFGTALWVIVMLKLYQDGRRHAVSTMEVYGVRIAWIVLVLGGIPNPTWHSTPILITLFALTVSVRRKADQISESSAVGVR
jgi:hypothetical protein